jgi:hypothetical protein
MAVMLAGIELPGVQTIHTDEERAIVEHRVPGLAGSILQDLGRGPTAVRLEGVIHGQEALDDLTALRDPFHAGDPVLFSADITTATDLSDVLIDDLQVREVAGRPNYFRYAIRLLEYVPPPAPAAPGLESPIDAEIDLAAGDFLDGVTDALSDLPLLDGLLDIDLVDPTAPLTALVDGFGAGVGGLGGTLSSLSDLLGPTE